MTLPRYEGWSNYPTWAVNLWLSNDESLYAIALEHRAEATTEEELSDNLKSLVEEYCLPNLSDGNLQADLIQWALAYVDWTELASGWWRDEL